MTKLYALALKAQRHEVRHIRVEVMATAVLAENEDEALGKGVRIALSKWSQDKDWTAQGAQ